MPVKPQRIVLVWTEADLAPWREGDYAVPLTAQAYVAIRHLDESRVLDAGDCIGEPDLVDGQATELLNGLHETLKSSRFPWFEAYANVIFETKAFQLIAWLVLVRSLQARFKPAAVEIQPPKVFSDENWSNDMFIYHLVRESFHVARQVLEREGVHFTTAREKIPWRPLRSKPPVKSILARTVACALPFGFPRLSDGDAVTRSLLPNEPVDVLLVGQQFGDAFHSAPLAKRLKQRFGKRFLWLGMRPAPSSNMTTEEIALISDLDFEHLRFLDSASVLSTSEEGTRSALLDVGSIWRIAGLLSGQSNLGVKRDEWFDFLSGSHLEGLAARYAGWSKLLDALRPKVVVGLSALQDMALIRAWTRRNKVPFVCFMHGAFYALKYSFDVDADYIGVFGKMLAEQLKQSGLPQPLRVVPCGAMQFADKAISFQKFEREGEEPISNTVLFLGFFDSLPFCPWSPADAWRMLSDVHKVCGENGKVLRVRPHPRFPASIWAPFVEELERQVPESIMISSEPSLSLDLAKADFVIGSGFDGAVLDALFARKLVVSYLPEGVEHIDHSRPLTAMGGMAHSLIELRDLFSDIRSKGKRTTGLRVSQKKFLEEYVENPGDDPWEKALDLIEDALRGKDAPPNSPPIFSQLNSKERQVSHAL